MVAAEEVPETMTGETIMAETTMAETTMAGTMGEMTGAT